MRYDFSTVDNMDSFVSVPEGSYVCRVGDVRQGQSRDGSERWRLKLVVAEGDYAGRLAAWDALTWSERGIHRVKMVLEALGFAVDGELELEPLDLRDRMAQVSIETEEWEDPVSGRRQTRMRVPYLGYVAVTTTNGNGNGNGSPTANGGATNGNGGGGDPPDAEQRFPF